MPEDAFSPPSTTRSDNPGGFSHIPALDGVRGFALLMILVDHLFWANSAKVSPLADLMTAIRSSTYCGVDLFFALSGFLITGILLDSLGVESYFKTFYARRALRIFPLYYASLLFMLLLSIPFHLSWHGWQYYYLTYTANLVLWHHTPLDLGYLDVNQLWSLQVEEQFYFVWPLVIYLVRAPAKIIKISLVGCAAVFLVRVYLTAKAGSPGFENIYLPYKPTFSCADNLLFGCCLCAALRTARREQILRLAPRVFAGCVLVLLALAIRHGNLDWVGDGLIPTIGFTLFGVTSCALIAMSLVGGSKTQSFFQGRILRFLGKYSYGIYVYHYSLVRLAVPCRTYLARYMPKAAALVLMALVIGGVSTLMAMASYRFFEARFLRLKSRFPYTRRAPEAQEEEWLAKAS